MEINLFGDIQTWYWHYLDNCVGDFESLQEAIKRNADDKKITIHINSRGGDIREAWSMYDFLRASGKEITCIVEGQAASAATIILMAAPKERRYAREHAEICIHNSRYQTFDNYTAEELAKMADELTEEDNKMVALYVERTDMSEDEARALMQEDKYISAEKAQEYGLIGNITQHITAKKMNKKKAQGLLIQFAKVLGLAEEPAATTELTTKAGETLTIEREDGKPEVGDKASPDGVFEFDNGTTIKVEEGVITEITEEDEDGTTAPENDDTPEEVKALQEENENLKKQIADLEAELSEAKKTAKSDREKRILTAVALAGGEEFLKKVASAHTPPKRENPDRKGKPEAFTAAEALKAYKQRKKK